MSHNRILVYNSAINGYRFLTTKTDDNGNIVSLGQTISEADAWEESLTIEKYTWADVYKLALENNSSNSLIPCVTYDEVITVVVNDDTDSENENPEETDDSNP